VTIAAAAFVRSAETRKVGDRSDQVGDRD